MHSIVNAKVFLNIFLITKNNGKLKLAKSNNTKPKLNLISNSTIVNRPDNILVDTLKKSNKTKHHLKVYFFVWLLSSQLLKKIAQMVQMCQPEISISMLINTNWGKHVSCFSRFPMGFLLNPKPDCIDFASPCYFF